MSRGDEYFKLAQQYECGDGREKNQQQAIYYYKLAIEYGNVDAYYKLGIIYLNEEQFEEAISNFEKALDNGITDACRELVKLFSDRKDYKRSLSYFFKYKHDSRECHQIIGLIDKYKNSAQAYAWFWWDIQNRSDISTVKWIRRI